jgi:hypothetical protein
MHPNDIKFAVGLHRGTAKTNNSFLEENGYVVVPSLYDPKKLYFDLPEGITGQLNYGKTIVDVTHVADEGQVSGSLSRYGHPQYRSVHNEIRLKLQEIIGKPLCNTYYYDRFYFEDQELVKHVDREACEISVSIHIGTNIKEPWAFCLTTPGGEDREVFLNPGDGVIYKGCEIVHWRDKMPLKKKWMDKTKYYYHQIFFHYVLRDGYKCQYAHDVIR